MTESTVSLDNPDRGFYYIHGFYVSEDMDCPSLLESSFSINEDAPLCLLEINLRHYHDKEISEKGLVHIQTLFDGIRSRNKHCILRFLYDWNGKNMETEPTSAEIIERHMEQVGPIINKNSDVIFTTQGIFVGNWGEMNGTRYVGTAFWKRLLRKYVSVTNEDIYLSVRMPMQWRQIIGSVDIDSAPYISRFAPRLGLFNDGMMGNESDLGTYGSKKQSEAEYSDAWCREDELAFQEKLCSAVPNGGEVVYDTPFNDFIPALDHLRTMHISYLNLDYDRKALDKWKNHTVAGQGIWDGMDGLTFVDRHLGYRYLIERSRLRWSFWNNTLDITAEVKNTGFAPIYHAARCALLFVSDGEVKHTIALDGDLRSLAGGRSQDKTLTFSTTLSMCDLPKADYQVYFKVTSEKYGSEIHLANKETVDGLGCLIGSIES